MKKCNKCNIEKDLQFFDLYKNRYSFECKECRRIRQNTYSKLHPRKYVYHKRPPGYYYKYVKIRREKAKNLYGIGSGFLTRYGLKVCLEVFNKCGKKCNICLSETDLTFHHLDGNGRNHENNKIRYLMNNNSDNLIVLCRKCHGSIDGKKNKGIKRKKTYN